MLVIVFSSLFYRSPLENEIFNLTGWHRLPVVWKICNKLAKLHRLKCPVFASLVDSSSEFVNPCLHV